MGNDKFFNKNSIFTIVGATDNHDKYGYKVFMDLKNKGYKVHPINPKLSEIEGVKCFSSIKDLEVKPDIVVMVVPPKVTEEIIKQVFDLGIKKVWMQPGSESEISISYCEKNNIEVVHNACVMFA